MAQCIRCGNIWKPPHQWENNKSLMENSKCPECGLPALAEIVFTPIGSREDTSYEEWKLDHLCEYAGYKNKNKNA